MTKADNMRVKGLLTEAIRMLCKSSLSYKTELSIEGLIGITLDNNDVFLVNINECVVVNEPILNNAAVTPQKTPAKRQLPKWSAKSDSACGVPKATAISSLPGVRAENEGTTPTQEDRSQPSGSDHQNGHTEGKTSDTTVVDIELAPAEDKAGGTAEIASLDFGDMLAKFEPEDIPQTDTDEPLGANVNSKDEMSFEYDDGEKQTTVTDDDDIVVIKEELASSSRVLNVAPPIDIIPIHEQALYNTPTTNLYPHNDYMTSFEEQGYSNPNVALKPNASPAGSLIRPSPKQTNRGKSRSNPYSPYKANKSSATGSASNTPGQQQDLFSLIAATNISASSLTHLDIEIIYDQEGNPMYPCPYMGCSKTYQSLPGCKQHILNTHVSSKHTCQFCGKTFSNRSGLRNHRVIKHNAAIKDKLRCPFCNDPFLSKPMLANHKQRCPNRRYHESVAKQRL